MRWPDRPHEGIRRIGDDQMSGPKLRDARRAAELRDSAGTIAEPEPCAGERPNPAVAANRDYAPALVCYVQLTIGSYGNAERAGEPVAVRPRRCGHVSVLVHGADDAVSGVGDIDDPARIDGDSCRRVEARAIRHSIVRARMP